MTGVSTEPDGRIVVEAPGYRLEVAADGLLARLFAAGGRFLAALRPLAALDTVGGPDETTSVAPPRLLGGPEIAIEVERASTRWRRAATTLVCTDDGIEVRTAIEGSGALADVHLLGGRSVAAGLPSGFLPSGSGFRTLFSPNPGGPRLVRGAGEPAVIGVSGDGSPGRGHWLFVPAPLCLALTPAREVGDPADPVARGWTTFALAAPVEELTFVQLTWRAADTAFSLALEYEGHTRVDGAFAAPAVLVRTGLADPYAGLRAHRADLVARGYAPPPAPRGRPAWWSEPIFCGWGAQCHLALANGRRPPDFSTQSAYDGFLAHLEAEGIRPGTVVVDDKWSFDYGTCEPDPGKWPDLRGWIAERHARGQRVLLWWKAWDPEGVPAELCIVNAAGDPVAVDPTNPAAREAVARAVARMLGPEGLDADGLKVDFTARTPSGHALAAHGDGWGIALLHRLLATVHAAAKAAKPDALVVTSSPHPAFAGVADMIRLNDMVRLDDPDPARTVLAQMRYRASVVRAACPELLIDTDDWCAPSLDEWRRYLEEKPRLGVPALYYASHLDGDGEAFEPRDYEALRETWAAWRAGAR